jgi:hypothetical protein
MWGWGEGGAGGEGGDGASQGVGAHGGRMPSRPYCHVSYQAFCPGKHQGFSHRANTRQGRLAAAGA